MSASVATLLVGLASAGAGALTAWLAFRSKAKDDRQALIDQLQEERAAEREERRLERSEFARQLAAERAEIAAERASHADRLDRMWVDKSASRNYIGALERHIWDGSPPPPPRPPDGYIP